ncbi:unnamed protein product [Cylindrotheca closterium]|uniref:VWFD domain-containing protein n=1 Tax=Cylindrotheca closterium TaxID=2856 RepID=A0AAD2FQ15_9STRA|nr:unnamed protein product [Cylindrotheca closterium]
MKVKVYLLSVSLFFSTLSVALAAGIRRPRSLVQERNKRGVQSIRMKRNLGKKTSTKSTKKSKGASTKSTKKSKGGSGVGNTLFTLFEAEGFTKDQAYWLDQITSSNKSDIDLFLDGDKAIEELQFFTNAVRSNPYTEGQEVSDREILNFLMGPTVFEPSDLDNEDNNNRGLQRSDPNNLDLRNDKVFVAAVNLGVEVLSQAVSEITSLPKGTLEKTFTILAKRLEPRAFFDFQDALKAAIRADGTIFRPAVLKEMGNFALTFLSNFSVKEIFAEVANNMTSVDYALWIGGLSANFASFFVGGPILKLTKLLVTLIDNASLAKAYADFVLAMVSDMPPDASPAPTGAPSPTPTEAPSPTPTGAPSPTPTGAPSPTFTEAPITSDDPCRGDPCCEDPSNCDFGGAAGDPHLVTFDNIRYSCQGKGDFVLFRLATSGLQIQTRFERLDQFVSLATGFAGTTGFSGHTIEISIPQTYAGKIDLFVDGSKLELGAGYDDDQFRVTVSGRTHTVFFKASKLSVVADFILIGVPHLEVNVRVPSSIRGDAISGLLGSPDGNPFNDWTTKNGEVLDTNFRFSNEDGYKYCTTEWCISDVSESLFTYNQAGDFLSLSGCDEEYPGSVDLSQASQELRELCGSNEACLVDGIVLGVEGAQSLLEAEASYGSSSLSNAFRASPNAVVADSPTDIVLTVDLSISDAPGSTEVEEFVVFEIDSETFEVSTVPVATLEDIGTGRGEDIVARDLIFSTVHSVESSGAAGSGFSFQAVPRINGELARDSPLVFTLLYAVVVYSVDSGIAFEVNRIKKGDTGILKVSAIEGLYLSIQYFWASGRSNTLVTGTSFLGEKVGSESSCPISSTYMYSAGTFDSLGSSAESVLVFFGDSHESGAWANQISIELNAHWNDGGGSGPVTVLVFPVLVPSALGSNAVDTEMLQFTVTPSEAAVAGCSTNKIGSVDVLVKPASDGDVTISVIPEWD